jgi:hypothetical protein
VFDFRTGRGSLTTKSWSLGRKLKAKRCEEIHLVSKHKWIEGWVLNTDKNCSNVWDGNLSSQMYPDWKPEDTKCDAITGLWQRRDVCRDRFVVRRKAAFKTAERTRRCGNNREIFGYERVFIEADLETMDPFKHIDIFAEPRQVMVWEPEVPPRNITSGMPSETEKLEQEFPWCQLVDQVTMDKPLDHVRHYTFDPQDPIMEVCTQIGKIGLEYIQFTTRSGHVTFINDPGLDSWVVSEDINSRFRLCADSGERLAGFRILYAYRRRDIPDAGTVNAWLGDLMFWTNKGRRSPRMNRWKYKLPFWLGEYRWHHFAEDFWLCKGQELIGICFGGVLGVRARSARNGGICTVRSVERGA